MPPPDNARPAAKNGGRPAQQDASSSSEAALHECEEMEAAIAELRNSYEQYFMGMERQAPIRAHEDLKKRMMKLKGAFIRSTAVKFRVQSLHNKFLTYERLWTRTLQEIEDGTYRRDLAKARRRAEKKKPGASAGQKGVVELPEEIDDMDFEEIEELAGRRPINEPKLASEYLAEQQTTSGGTPFRGTPAVAPAAAQPAVAPVTIPPVGAPRGTPAGLVPPKQGVPAVSPVSGLPSIAPVGGTPQKGTPAVGTSKLPSVTPAVPPGMAAKAPAATQPARPTAPAAAAPRPAAAGPNGGMSDDKLRAVYDAYVTAKRRCQEDTSKLSYESVAATLRKQVPELLKQHNAKAVEFKVVIKDGKASLKAVPK
ncbi:MXAN_5187 C-terminal domain-containing protein [Corallococcus sp. EGB]|uniref:MXAN_5187 C-terminal domain-containing protein n=1 Tax=Corallococcus sp. EGB TaxID=1521117 RepID=UPI001CBD7C09|nr:MXAN_5187 C-terminal domain-containing protein [Corallococcus sp. EGB]